MIPQPVLYFAGGVLLGALAGGGGVYLALNKKTKRALKDLDEEVMISRGLHKKLRSALRENEPETQIISDVNPISVSVVGTPGPVTSPPLRVPVAYNKVVRNYTVKPMPDRGEERDADVPVEENEDWPDDLEETDPLVEIAVIDRTMPHVITHLDWEGGTPDHYQRTTLTYYATDDILADERDAVIDDPEYALGDGLSHFGEESNDADIVYVRNPTLNEDFEIVRVHRSYAEAVFGFKEKKNKRLPKMRDDEF